jgi:D-alanyl-D-alanine dipeptidase
MLRLVRDYGDLLVDAARAGVPDVGGAALPQLHTPAYEPPYPAVLTHAGEPLVPLAGLDRVAVLPAYARSGWPNATPGVVARAGAAERLRRAAATLPDGFGVVVLDAWRPLELQRDLYDDVYGTDPHLPPGFVSLPSDDPDDPPPHLTGGAIDLTLSWRGVPLALGTGFDEFTRAAYADAFEERAGTVRALRRLLYWTMRAQGYVVLDCEWWHFEYGTRTWAALTRSTPRYPGTRPTN